ncbi:MAG: PilZ domain-containing protein [Treponema sp.]|jgi:hypothetical protein|nr:PilZ domain-containing protein [Treponema sp.]
MNLLLVLGSDDAYNRISLLLNPLGFEMIRYRHVQKAMDNIDEIDPAGIIISASDFPRHWKTFACFVRYDRPKQDCPIVLLKGSRFPEEETNKAAILEINGLLMESLENPEETKSIHTLLAGRSPAKKTGTGENWTRFGFVFSHPKNRNLVTGRVKIVCSMGVSFEPDDPKMIEDLKDGEKLPLCSFRAGDDILSPSCVLRRNGKIMSLDFSSFPRGEKKKLGLYLEDACPK